MTRRSVLGAYAALRWPLTPLLELARQTPIQFAHTHGISGTAIRQAETDGLNDRQADRWTIRSGYHPAQVWGPDWFAAALIADVAADREPAPTRHRNTSKRSTGRTAPRTCVPVRPSVEAMAS